MTKKVVILAVLIAVVAIIAVVLFTQKREITDYNATARNLRAGHERIACEDAKWLFANFADMIGKKFERFEKLEKPYLDNSTAIDNDTIMKIRQEIEDNATPSQKEIIKWQNDITVYVNEIYKGDKEKIKSVSDSVGRDFLDLYQGAMAVKLGMINEAEAKNVIESSYCSGDIH